MPSGLKDIKFTTVIRVAPMLTFHFEAFIPQYHQLDTIKVMVKCHNMSRGDHKSHSWRRVFWQQVGHRLLCNACSVVVKLEEIVVIVVSSESFIY